MTTVADEARCFLAHQHQRVVDSILRLFPEDFRRHVDLTTPAEATLPEPILPITNLTGDPDKPADLDFDHLTKQPDWSHDPTDSGQAPAERYAGRAP